MCLEDTVRIPLRARDGSVRAYALVDADDAKWLNEWPWHLTPQGYARRSGHLDGQPIKVLLHRAVMGLPQESDGRTVDHINRNKLDDRKRNLRVVSQAENAQNRSSYRGSTSQHRGVHWSLHHRKWIATVVANGRQIRLGQFDDENEAADVARAARRRFLPFSRE